jgi:preprotein translocase subunit YajC
MDKQTYAGLKKGDRVVITSYIPVLHGEVQHTEEFNGGDEVYVKVDGSAIPVYFLRQNLVMEKRNGSHTT